jgi:hypothetical protein
MKILEEQLIETLKQFNDYIRPRGVSKKMIYFKLVFINFYHYFLFPLPFSRDFCNTSIDYVELSMTYFDGCDTAKLRFILDELVNRGICENDPLDTSKYRLI